MRRRISLLLISLFLLLTTSSCGGRNVLLFLNWGEYVDETLLEEFENIYNCEVMMELGDTNEIFYSKVRGGTTVFDVVCPSDYMVEKMYRNDMLAKIDFSKMENYSPNSENIMPGIKGLYETLEERCAGITDYCVPYLWGTWGIMYSTVLEGLETAILNAPNEWSSLFDRSSLPSGTRVAMYDSYQHVYYALSRYLGYDPHQAATDNDKLNQMYNTIKNMGYNAWGTDDIKKDIVAGNIDLGYMWTGDFLYYYCENVANVVMDAYLAGDVEITEIGDMINILTSDERVYKDEYQVGFDIFIPSDTVAFIDNYVIPKDSLNYDLALKFIDFMCSRSAGPNEVDPAYSNTYYVSYNTPFIAVYDDITAMSEMEFSSEMADLFNEEVASGVDAYDTTLYWNAYDMAIGIAFNKYYPKEEKIVTPNGIRVYRGDMLACFDRNYINIINQTFNNARA